MTTHNLMDKESKAYYIKAPFYLFIITLIVLMGLLVLSVWYVAARIFFIMDTVNALVFFYRWMICKKRYGNTLSYQDGTITLYDFKNTVRLQAPLCSFQARYTDVVFPEGRTKIHKKCLVLFSDADATDGMEYESYWDETNMIIVQNPQLIDILRRHLNGISDIPSVD